MWIATAGVGFVPGAPGTYGSLLAALLFVPLSRLGFVAHLTAAGVATLVGLWASGAAEAALGKSDDGRIVIDEVAGQLLALTPLAALEGVPALQSGPLAFGGSLWILLFVTAFVVFRWFDIAKPGPVRWAEQRFRGGVGVMADDLVAGALAGCALSVVGFGLLVADLRGVLPL